MPLILPGNVGSATAATGYDVANSCRFDYASSDYVHKTPGSAGSGTKFVFSTWIKRTKLATAMNIIYAQTATNNYERIRFVGTDKIEISGVASGSTAYNFATDAVYRDPSAWMHLHVIRDSTQGTASNRLKVYVNGVLQALTQDTAMSENYSGLITGANVHRIGIGNGEPLGAYLAEVILLDGQVITPDGNTGEFDSDSPTIWKPIDVSGLTFGTTGFYLDFEASGNLGNDANGGDDFTEVNIDATNQSTDTCTNNFCTCNPLDQTNTGGSSATMAEGNLKWTSAGNATSQSYMRATFGLTAGKWYWEAKMSAANSGPGFQIGVAGTDANMNAGSSGSMNDSDPNTQFVNAASSASSTRKDGSNVTTSLTTVAEDQIVQIALDLDNQKFYIGVQGTYLNSADPAAGSNAPATVDANTTYLPAWCDNGYADQITLELNFGNPTFSISSGNTDGNGYGNFEYAPPSGFLALCTKNLGSDGG